MVRGNPDGNVAVAVITREVPDVSRGTPEDLPDVLGDPSRRPPGPLVGRQGQRGLDAALAGAPRPHRAAASSMEMGLYTTVRPLASVSASASSANPTACAPVRT